ncbi:MAG: EamA/RhaT family transporter [Enterovirga sp.]|jgi:drug/metabolite transporter (DMT)-like permease|nr:EamA/RhaT family transporter [Enterovirga sp.]
MKPRDILWLLLWTAGALVSFSATAVAVRLMAHTLSLFEVLSVRNFAGLAILLGAVALRPELRRQLRPGKPWLHVIRNTTHFIGQCGWNSAITVLPLATAFALEFTAPIWLAAMAVPLLGERLTLPRAGAIVLGIAGILVILRPGHEAFQPAALVMLGAAVLFAGVAVATKRLTRTVSTFTILFWMNASQLPLSLAGSNLDFPSRLDAAGWTGAAMLAVTGLTSHLCLTQAYRYGDAVVVMPLDFLRIPMIALIGWQFYGEALDPFVFVGAVLIVVGIVWNLSAEARRAAPALAEPETGRGPAPAPDDRAR